MHADTLPSSMTPSRILISSIKDILSFQSPKSEFMIHIYDPYKYNNIEAISRKALKVCFTKRKNLQL